MKLDLTTERKFKCLVQLLWSESSSQFPDNVWWGRF